MRKPTSPLTLSFLLLGVGLRGEGEMAGGAAHPEPAPSQPALLFGRLCVEGVRPLFNLGEITA